MKKNTQNLNIKAWATTLALLWGIYLFFAAIFAINNTRLFWFSNEAFSFLASIYPGLSASIGGAFLGLIYGLICGAICGALFSWLHNKTLNWYN